MPKRYIPALIIYIAVIIGTVYFYMSESKFISGMNTATGSVVALGSGFTTTVSINGQKRTTTTTDNKKTMVDFLVSGKTYRAEGRGLGIPSWELGQVVEVYYQLGDPDSTLINRIDEVYLFTSITLFLAVLMTLWVLFSFAYYKITGRVLS